MIREDVKTRNRRVRASLSVYIKTLDVCLM